MTSFIISSHLDRKTAPSWATHPDCPFCAIVKGDRSAFRVYEGDHVIAILDILPLRPGHTLVIPKAHYPRLSDLPAELAGAVGAAVSRVARALVDALDNTALNVVCNQEYAQAVPHVHYHIIPAPDFKSQSKISPPVAQATADGGQGKPLSYTEMHKRELEAREELDDDEAAGLVKRIRARL